MPFSVSRNIEPSVCAGALLARGEATNSTPRLGDRKGRRSSGTVEDSVIRPFSFRTGLDHSFIKDFFGAATGVRRLSED